MLNALKRFWNEEDGLGIVEIALIIIVLIAVVVIFRTELETFVKGLFKKATENVDNL